MVVTEREPTPQQGQSPQPIVIHGKNGGSDIDAGISPLPSSTEERLSPEYSTDHESSDCPTPQTPPGFLPFMEPFPSECKTPPVSVPFPEPFSSIPEEPEGDQHVESKNEETPEIESVQIEQMFDISSRKNSGEIDQTADSAEIEHTEEIAKENSVKIEQTADIIKENIAEIEQIKGNSVQIEQTTENAINIEQTIASENSAHIIQTENIIKTEIKQTTVDYKVITEEKLNSSEVVEMTERFEECGVNVESPDARSQRTFNTQGYNSVLFSPNYSSDSHKNPCSDNMIQVAYFLVFLFSVSSSFQLDNVTTKPQSFDLREHMMSILETAYHHIYHDMPSAGDIFHIKDSPTLLRMETDLKRKILGDLLEQILDVWAEMNVKVMKGLAVVKSMRDKAKALVDKLKNLGGEHLLKTLDIKQRLAEKVRDLLNTSKTLFCGVGDDSENFFSEDSLQNLMLKLELDNVKKELLRVVYYNRINGLSNITDFQQSESEEDMHELWSIVTMWGKWIVLDLISYIRNPVENLHTEVQSQVQILLNNIQDLMQETLAAIIEIVVSIDDIQHLNQLMNIYNAINGEDNALHSICRL